jgi:superfamily I DNA/RNA helicase
VKEREGSLSPEVMREELHLATLLDRIHLKGPVDPLIKLPAGERGYLEALLIRHGEIPEPKIHLTTVHGAKGREAETVVVIPDMSRATYSEYLDRSRGGFEAENRVAYVAVTRARRRLALVAPRTRRFYDFPVPESQCATGERPSTGAGPSCVPGP